jgi:hypothetical protein
VDNYGMMKVNPLAILDRKVMKKDN